MSKPKKSRIDENYMKKFGMLVEYNYNVPPTDNETKDLLLDEEDEEELGPEDFGIETEEGSEEVEGDFGGEEEATEEFGDVEGEESFEDDLATDDFGTEEEVDADVEVSEDGVELDVTDIVNNTEEAKQISNSALEKIESIMGAFASIEDKLSNVDAINAKLDSLEQEFEKRNPTDVEKMEMRSLDSYPYNLKLTDFWSEKEGYDVGTPVERTDDGEVEYKLTDEIIDATYNEEEAKASFDEEEDEEM